MSKFYLSGTNSDLTGGLRFNKKLLPNTETAGSISFTVAQNATENSYGYTEANVPGFSLPVGDYTVKVNVTTGHKALRTSIAVSRVNSAGVQQAISVYSAEAENAGKHSFTLTDIDLGTWASTDRLRVVYRFRDSANTHGGLATTIQTGTTDTEVLIPNNPPTVQLDSPADKAKVGTTPDLKFTGTDLEKEDIEYNVRISPYCEIGKYVGDGVDEKIISGLSFRPDVVIIRCMDNYTVDTAWKTDLMPEFGALPTRNDSGMGYDLITLIRDDGFRLGDSTFVNANGKNYSYIALKKKTGLVTTFSYTGDATQNRQITGFGFQPDYVKIKADDTITGAHKFKGRTDTSMFFGGPDRADLIKSFDAGGITISDGGAGANLVNIDTKEHYGFALKEDADLVRVVEYVGNDADNRDVYVADNIRPGFVIIKGAGWQPCVYRTSEFPDGYSVAVEGEARDDNIKSFSADNFRLGEQWYVNELGRTFSALIFRGDIDALSETPDAGFSNLDTPADTHPFKSDDQIQFTVQSADELSDGIYYWRVRGKDPTGSGKWGAWSTVREFEAEAISPEVTARSFGQIF